MEIMNNNNNHDIAFFDGCNIPVIKDGSYGEYIVYARDLWDFLQVKTPFHMWIRRKLDSTEFIENMDYITIEQKRVVNNGGYKIVTEYYLTSDTAKKLGMMQSGEMGRKVRKYFIYMEEQLQEYMEIQSLQEQVMNRLRKRNV